MQNQIKNTVNFYIRNSAKKGCLVSLQKANVNLEEISKIITIKFGIPQHLQMLFYGGRQITGTQPFQISQRAIIHVVDQRNLGSKNCKIILRKVVKDHKKDRKYQVQSDMSIDSFISNKLSPDIQQPAESLSLIYTGRQLKRYNTFSEEYVESNSQIFWVSQGSHFKNTLQKKIIQQNQKQQQKGNMCSLQKELNSNFKNVRQSINRSDQNQDIIQKNENLAKFSEQNNQKFDRQVFDLQQTRTNNGNAQILNYQNFQNNQIKDRWPKEKDKDPYAKPPTLNFLPKQQTIESNQSQRQLRQLPKLFEKKQKSLQFLEPTLSAENLDTELQKNYVSSPSKKLSGAQDLIQSYSSTLGQNNKHKNQYKNQLLPSGKSANSLSQEDHQIYNSQLNSHYCRSQNDSEIKATKGFIGESCSKYFDEPSSPQGKNTQEEFIISERCSTQKYQESYDKEVDLLDNMNVKAPQLLGESNVSAQNRQNLQIISQKDTNSLNFTSNQQHQNNAEVDQNLLDDTNLDLNDEVPKNISENQDKQRMENATLGKLKLQQQGKNSQIQDVIQQNLPEKHDQKSDYSWQDIRSQQQIEVDLLPRPNGQTSQIQAQEIRQSAQKHHSQCETNFKSPGNSRLNSVISYLNKPSNNVIYNHSRPFKGQNLVQNFTQRQTQMIDQDYLISEVNKSRNQMQSSTVVVFPGNQQLMSHLLRQETSLCNEVDPYFLNKNETQFERTFAYKDNSKKQNTKYHQKSNLSIQNFYKQKDTDKMRQPQISLKQQRNQRSPNQDIAVYKQQYQKNGLLPGDFIYSVESVKDPSQLLNDLLDQFSQVL